TESSTGGSDMRRYLLSSIAALALGSVSPAALAADFAPPEPVPVMSWTGFYLGAGGGLAWAELDVNHKHCLLYDDVCSDDPVDNFHRDFSQSSDAGGVGIVQGGFDWEVAPSFVVGFGADWTFGEVFGDNENRFHDDVFGFDGRFHND